MRAMTALFMGLLALVLLAPTAAYAADDCGSDGRWGVNCSISNSDTQVDLSGTTTKPGTGTGNTGGTAHRPAQPQPPPKANPCTTPLCRDNYTVAKASDVYPEVSTTDLASFRPRAASMQHEPAGAAIVGMPSNVVAEASTHEIAGELFGFAVAVRFVPVSYTFEYGDGTVRTVGTGGASWAALGQAEFTPTPTSHVFQERGTRRVTAWVNYRASVLFDDSYRRDVAGIVRGAAQGTDVRVVAVRTALVDQTCRERPSGPGC